MRLLIVHDQAFFRDGIVKLLLAQPDITVAGEADSIRDSVEKVLATEPDIVLMDLDLYDGDGFDVLKAILLKRPQTKVAILAKEDSYDREKLALLSGAKGYVLKRTPIAKIVASLQAVERGELAFSRAMMSRVLEEFTRLGVKINVYQASMGSLTTRELEVLRLLGFGATNRQIADRLQIAENTVKIHVRNIYDKLKLRNRLEALMFARRAGLVSTEEKTKV